jgi:hypothetical protein
VVDEFEDIERPTAETVASRAIILSVVSCRAFTSAQPEDPEAAVLATRSYDWLCTLGLEGSLTDWERGVLTAPFGTLPQTDIITGTWLIEAVGVLSWALRNIELPPFDQQCDPPEIANSLGFLEPIEGTSLNKAVLRSKDEFSRYNDFIYNLHWRLRDCMRRKQAYDCTNLLGEYDGQYGFKLIGRDVCVGGAPLSEVNEPTLRSIMSVTQERHRASNWLVGYDSEDFYSVPTDT